MKKRLYRPCVVGVIQNDDKDLYLAGERSDFRHSWQFPQGGIEVGEVPETALLRELQEEIGESRVRILGKSKDWVRYDFPEQMTSPIKKDFIGQEQIWFLLKFDVDGDETQLRPGDGEFTQLSWKSLDFIVGQMISWKRAAYLSGLKSIGLTIDA